MENADIGEAPVVIVTGAGKGLGRAYALLLAQRGARVIVNNRIHRDEASHCADEVVAEIRAAGGDALAHYGSAEDPATGEDLLAAALQRYGRLDAVIANAGISEGKSFHKQTLADFGRVMDINLNGTVNLLHPTFQYFYRVGAGAIVVSTSAAGLYGEHGLPAYSASKAALVGLMHALAHEGAGHGIRVNALAPFAETGMTAGHLPDELREVLAPEQVAPVVAWLIDRACPLNGEIVVCGAGRLALARYLTTPGSTHPTGTESGPEAMSQWWQRQVQVSPDRHHTSAVALFRDFVSLVG